MHELAITEGIIKIAKEVAEKNNAKRVLNIKVKCGDFSGVIPSLIQEYFDIVSKGTIVEGAKLLIDRVPIKIICSECNNESEIKRSDIRCPKCGGYRYRIISGKEFYVEALEVE
ncbi:MULTISPECIES: hydrogenase maturation nickel metallochaperone HypA [Caloramator]|uniref:Hydrogenase maturation factor HypA n=1 Tax=Caloramator australicus RC3 TaxID=857293 RepID=I7J503_9CLOT|nr:MULTISPECIES: hydrogenase maturation nickel metallochaperone HypA [Caloramator]MDO6354432.1 hydrogenase maturation nickel metallochaperone HypA [Caloramator sp. CAR-1]CCJ33336.1 [NiFe] hydrogenase nickel incorporation protein HypA [Caloramator australicus RC3]